MSGKDTKVTQNKRNHGTTIKELPSEERPREKMIRYGSATLTNGELLAILIGTGTQNRSALTLANRILSMEEAGISYLTDCAPEELSKIDGIGMAKSCQILAAIELGKRLSRTTGPERYTIASPADVASLFMEEMRYRKKEVFKVLFLNTKNEIIFTEDVSIGNLNSSIVHPREVFRSAVKRGAAAIIVLHNHPSGNPLPSDNDQAITKRLVEAGDLLGIPVLDHLIIGDGTFLSFKEKMYM